MVGHKLGEFAPTRTYRGHEKSGQGPMSRRDADTTTTRSSAPTRRPRARPRPPRRPSRPPPRRRPPPTRARPTPRSPTPARPRDEAAEAAGRPRRPPRRPRPPPRRRSRSAPARRARPRSPPTQAEDAADEAAERRREGRRAEAQPRAKKRRRGRSPTRPTRRGRGRRGAPRAKPRRAGRRAEAADARRAGARAPRADRAPRGAGRRRGPRAGASTCARPPARRGWSATTSAARTSPRRARSSPSRPRAAAKDWAKLLESAVANAEHNHELVGEDLRDRRRLRRRGADAQALPPARHGPRDAHPQAHLPPDDHAHPEGALEHGAEGTSRSHARGLHPRLEVELVQRAPLLRLPDRGRAHPRPHHRTSSRTPACRTSRSARTPPRSR